ncbi:MAG: hypothetical protein FJ317_01600 [SAR202 cluster bacterium]|nr:hypothetical protein [SAR202 cluster bacterium]
MPIDWIPAKIDLGAHPKLRKLARDLDVPQPQAVGHLFYLWAFAARYAPDGDLGRYTPEELADPAHWDGDPPAFTGALRSAGFLDEDGRLHDWMDHSGKSIAQYEKEVERSRSNREKARATKACKSREHVPYADDTCTVRVPYTLEKRREEERRRE